MGIQREVDGDPKRGQRGSKERSMGTQREVDGDPNGGRWAPKCNQVLIAARLYPTLPLLVVYSGVFILRGA